jgi:hypothetical protein
MRLPEFLTFVGPDEATPIDGLAELQRLYPLEWGMKLDPKHQGHGAYPTMDFIFRVADHASPMRLSAHLSGEMASRAQLADFGTPLQLLRPQFQRVLIDAPGYVNTGRLRVWAVQHQLSPIARCQNMLPDDDNCHWLCTVTDMKDGAPAWPRPPKDVFSGYTGGLTAHNIGQAVQVIGQMGHPYWLQIERGVRDAKGAFSVKLCRAICAAVYGARS